MKCLDESKNSKPCTFGLVKILLHLTKERTISKAKRGDSGSGRVPVHVVPQVTKLWNFCGSLWSPESQAPGTLLLEGFLIDQILLRHPQAFSGSLTPRCLCSSPHCSVSARIRLSQVAILDFLIKVTRLPSVRSLLGGRARRPSSLMVPSTNPILLPGCSLHFPGCFLS